MTLLKKSKELIIAQKEFASQDKEQAKSINPTFGGITESNEEEEYIGHLASIVESSDDAIISKSLDGIIKSWNKGSEKMLGYTAKEMVGQNISLIIPQDYRSEEKKIVERIRRNEIIDHYETMRIKKNGEQLYVSLTVSPLKDRDGKIIGISKIARDITARKRSETELIHINKELADHNEEKEERAAELIIANKELAFQNNEKENRAAELIIANKELAFQNNEKEKRATELTIANTELAYQNKEKENRADELIIANKELAFQNKEKEKRADELTIANTELAFQNEEKENRAAELIIANKELAYQNNEKEKRADELIIANKELAFQNKEKENRADELIIANKELAFQNKEKENRADELIIANKELAFQNKEKEKRADELTIANTELAFQNEEKENRAAELIIANKELAYQNKEKEDRAAELIIANKELAFQNKEKEDRAAELIIAIKELAFQNEEKEKSAAELIVANGELESFSYSVSHDLRAPLRAIHGYTQMFKGKYETQFDAEATRLMNNIIRNAKKMGQLIDDLLAFSRIGRNELVKMNIHMEDVVTDLCSELKKEQGDRIIDFHIQHLLPSRADNIAIKQVWQNLISNAIKYSKFKDHAIIEIGSEIKKDEIIYSIKDNGAGFDMRYADKLFGVFQRLHSEEEFEGTGVGLALVHRIIAKHGGRVWAEGKVNEGATFYFTLHKS